MTAFLLVAFCILKAAAVLAFAAFVGIAVLALIGAAQSYLYANWNR